MGITLINSTRLINILMRKDAEDILNKAYEITKDYEYVRVSDIKDLCGIDSEYADIFWRWSANDIRAAKIVHDSGYYEILFPEPKHDNPYHEEGSNCSVKDQTEETEGRNYIDPIYITIHTNHVEDFSEAIAEVFKHAYTIKDRIVNINIQ